MNITFIPLILFLVFSVTMVNLFYKPLFRLFWLQNYSWTPHFLKTAADPIEASLCPQRGFKCADPTDCDCSKLCSPAENFEKTTLLEGDDTVILWDVKLEPGTYCLPRGMSTCNSKSSIPIYSTKGWYCAPRNRSMWRGNYRFACKNPSAVDNSLNVLMDTLEERPVREDEIIENDYEMTANVLRYQCVCGSLDKNGNRMHSILPFQCSVDYCMKELKNLPKLGWNAEKKQCDCGPYLHKNPMDDSSPCVLEQTRIVESEGLKMLVGRVQCMTEESERMYPIYCPTDEPLLRFEKIVQSTETPAVYLTRITSNE